MKKVIGTLVLLLSIVFIGILILRIWDIRIVSMGNLARSGATLALTGIALVILVVVYGACFRKQEKGYRNDTGKRAHPKS